MLLMLWEGARLAAANLPCREKDSGKVGGAMSPAWRRSLKTCRDGGCRDQGRRRPAERGSAWRELQALSPGVSPALFDGRVYDAEGERDWAAFAPPRRRPDVVALGRSVLEDWGRLYGTCSP